MSQHPALITGYDGPPTLILVLPPHLGKDQVLAGLARAIGQARTGLANRARTFQQRVEEYAAAGDQLRQALCRGQCLASGDAAAHLDEAIVAVFDLWDQYDAQLAAQAAATSGQAAAPAVAFPGQQPPAPPAGGTESPAAIDGVPSPHPASDDLGPYIEAADEVTLRRALRAVAGHLDRLRQVARASEALGKTAKSAAHDQHAVAAEAADAWCAPGRSPAGLAAVAVEAYFSYLGFAAAAVHTDFCVNTVAAALTSGLGLTGPPGDRAAWEGTPPPGQAGRG